MKIMIEGVHATVSSVMLVMAIATVLMLVQYSKYIALLKVDNQLVGHSAAVELKLEDDCPTFGHNLPYKPVIAIFGGSVTAGVNLPEPTRNRYAGILEKLLNVTVRAQGVPAAGPNIHIHCGVDKADVIISEFRLNEMSLDRMDAWYNVTDVSSQHTVVLSLWSWLHPPSEVLSAPVRALLNSMEGHPERRSTFSMVPMDQFHLWDWRKLVPKYFTRHPEHFQAAIQECFEIATSIDPNDQMKFDDCRKISTGGAQHGAERYHYDVALLLARHLVDIVFPLLNPITTLANNEVSSKQCIGQYQGLGNIPQWNTAIQHKTENFRVGIKFGNKISLHSSTVNEQVTLACPNNEFKSARLAYLATNVPEDVAVFTINNITLSTAIPGSKFNFDVHVMEFSPSFTLPLEISTVSFASENAALQFLILSCSRSSS